MAAAKSLELVRSSSADSQAKQQSMSELFIMFIQRQDTRDKEQKAHDKEVRDLIKEQKARDIERDAREVKFAQDFKILQ